MHGVAFVLLQQPTQGHKGACPRTCKSWSSLKRHKQLDLQTPVLDSQFSKYFVSIWCVLT